jgi:hypothetical protein
VALSFELSSIVTTALALQVQGDQSTPLSEPLIKWMFTTGVLCIAVTWTAIPIIFAYYGKLDEVIDLLRRGTVVRFVTITYIVLVIVILSITGKMSGDKVSTLLASIAGYVLGQATQAGRREPEPKSDKDGPSPDRSNH